MTESPPGPERPGARSGYLSLVVAIALVLVAGEALLEVRAHMRGFRTLVGDLVEDRLADGVAPAAGAWGPTEDFPFASRRDTDTMDPDPDRPLLWIASSSYALGDESSFPRFAEDTLSGLGVDAVVLTQAAPGLGVVANTDALRRHGDRWVPDVVVLYQLTNDLQGLATGAGIRDPEPGSEVENPPLRAALRRLYERTTLFAQLSANFTPWFSQHQLSPAALPPAADSVFARRLRSFIAEVRELGAEPVLSTLATSHEVGDDLPRATRFWTLRWAPDYGPEAYLRTVSTWNGIIRDEARAAGVALFDATEVIGGRPEFYTDLVHLTDEGKRRLGGALARNLAERGLLTPDRAP